VGWHSPHSAFPPFPQVKADKPPEPSYCSLVLTDENGHNYFIGAFLSTKQP
jgi:hypothetical protein